MDKSATEELNKEVTEALEQGKLAEALEKIKKRLSDVENTPLNIAITGESGTGKSTFINSIRGIGDEEEDSAKTGVVETTMEPTPYHHPQHKSVTYWDLPGIGTPNFNATKYLEDVNFSQYDFFIIIASDRFRENDLLLAKEICKMNKKFYFVRSKIDRDIRDSKERRPNTFNEVEILDRIRQNCVESLVEGGITDQPVFLVSSFEAHKFDLSQLLNKLEEDLPSHKRYVYLVALPNISSEAIENKKKALESAVPWVAAGAVGASIVPAVSSLAENISLTLIIKYYIQSFGVDEKSLVDLANASGRSVSELKSLMKSPFVRNEVNNDLVWKELERRKGRAYMITKSVFSRIPLLSLIVAGPMSATACCELLYSALNEIAEDAKTAIQTTINCSDQ